MNDELRRISIELAKQIDILQEEINKTRKDGQKVSKIEISRIIAQYVETTNFKGIIIKVVPFNPNGNRYGSQVFLRFPGRGLNI